MPTIHGFDGLAGRDALSGTRKALVGAGAIASGLAVFVLGLVGSVLGSDGWVALQLCAMAALVAWPLFLRSAPLSARGALTAGIVAALVTGFHHSPCGRDGQGSASEICLGQCDESVDRLRGFERDGWDLDCGRLGRWALAVTCGTADPLRDWRDPQCIGTDAPPSR